MPNIKKYEEESLSRKITKDDVIFPRELFRKTKILKKFNNNYAHSVIISYAYRSIFNQKDFPQFWKHNGKKNECVIQSHNFRRTFATRSAESGMAIQDLSRILGHSNIETTMILL